MRVLRILAVFFVAVVSFPLFVLGADAVTFPTLVGHRGVGNPWTAELGIPEQSVPAIKWAAAHHADVLEGDVQRSSDGVMYMMHDETLDRTTNGTGPSTGRPWSYIRERWLEIPDGTDNPPNTTVHPPSFHYWLTEAKKTNKLVFVELKNGAAWSSAEVREFWAEVKRLDMTSRTIVAGSETDLATAKGAGAGKRSWGVDAAANTSMTKIRSVVGTNGYVTMRLTDAEAYPEYVKRLNSAGLRVFLWTLTNSDHYERALPFAVYGWMCNNTDDAWTWLQDNGA